MFASAFAALTAEASLPPDRAGPIPVDLDAVTWADAAELDGRPVRATITADTTAVTYSNLGLTAAGWERDGASGTLYLKGTRDVRPKTRVEAVGVLKVVDHPACTVNGVWVPEWSEIRVDER